MPSGSYPTSIIPSIAVDSPMDHTDSKSVSPSTFNFQRHRGLSGDATWRAGNIWKEPWTTTTSTLSHPHIPSIWTPPTGESYWQLKSKPDPRSSSSLSLLHPSSPLLSPLDYHDMTPTAPPNNSTQQRSRRTKSDSILTSRPSEPTNSGSEPSPSSWTRAQLQLPRAPPPKGEAARARPNQYCAWCGQLGHSKPSCADLTAALQSGKVRLEGGKIALALNRGRGEKEETIPYPHGRGTLRDWVKRRYKELGIDIKFGSEDDGTTAGEKEKERGDGRRRERGWHR